MYVTTTATTLAQPCVLAASGRPRSPFPICREGWTDLYLETGDENSLRYDLVLDEPADIGNLPDLEICRSVIAIEDQVIETVRPLLPQGRRAQCILGFPGRSKTDPLYALRLLEKARAITGQPGYLIVYDQDDHAVTQRYYQETLPLTMEPFQGNNSDAPHTLIPHWGIETGAIEYVRPQLGHIAMALMPGRHYELVTMFFETVLVTGGVAIWAHDYGVEYGDWEVLQAEMMVHIRRNFNLLAEPVVPSPFRTPFSARFPNNHAMLLQKKA